MDPMPRRRLGPLVALLALLVPALAGAAEGWRLQLISDNAGSVLRADVTLDGDHLMASAEGRVESMILGRDAITVVDHVARTYVAIPYVVVEQMLGGVKRLTEEKKAAQIAALREALDEVPEDQRAVLEAELDAMAAGGARGSRWTLTDHGPDEPVAGLPTRRYTIHENGEPIGEAWFTDAIDFDLFREIHARMEPYLPPEATEEGEEFFALLRGAPGVPVRMETVPGSPDPFHYRVLRAQRITVAPSVFAPPEGYAVRNFLENILREKP